ncbi:MAG: hypothetical protein WAO90_13440 [Mycobacterium sp.]
MTQMPAIPPIDTATDPVDTPDDMGDRWRALMGPLGFGQRLLWVGFVGADRRMHKILSQVPLGRSPHRALVDNLMLGLSVLLETDFAPGTSVALLLTRPGADPVSVEDRRWATVLAQAAQRCAVPLEPMFRANDTALEAL